MSIMYNLTRQEAADKLKISTRSVDRYIKAGKLRSQKEGKVVYINSTDVENFSSNGSSKQEIIINNNNNNKVEEKELIKENAIVKNNETNSGTLNQIYKDLREEITKKDEIIQVLSIRVGKAEEIAKNSISIMEHKKNQLLLEEAKGYLNKEVDELKKDKEKLTQDLKYEKNTNIILIIFVIVLLIISGVIWFIKI